MEDGRHKIKSLLPTLFLAAFNLMGRTDVFIIAPTPTGPLPGPSYVATFFPFFLQQIQLTSMRYQQVYSASVFSNVPPECLYVTTLTFFQDINQQGTTKLTITNMQVNLSTTQRPSDGLSSNFEENVGPDDTVVFGAGPHEFDDTANPGRFPIFLDRPFRYNAASGNLLVDVRILNGAGPVAHNFPALSAFNSSTDEVSRVWATNVAFATATGADTTGLDTVIQFSPVPSLRIYSSTFNTPTNYIAVEWATQPTVFVLQQSTLLGNKGSWQTITNNTGGPSASFQRYFLPVESTGPAAFYRLVWESGQPVRAATFPFMPAKTIRETLPME